MTGDLGLDELHRWLAKNEPKYMIPRYLERRESFPKTPSERIQKHRLKDLPLDRAGVVDYEARH